MIKLNTENYVINVPSSVKEIVDVIPDVVSNIVLAKHYCIVCIAERTNMYNLKLGVQEKVSEIIPILAKYNEDDREVKGFEIGNTIICDSLAIERATHIYSPLSVSKSAIINYFKNVDKNKLKSVSLSRPDAGDTVDNKIEYTSKDICYTLSFKIMSINEIKGVIPFDKKLVDVFVKMKAN